MRTRTQWMGVMAGVMAGALVATLGASAGQVIGWQSDNNGFNNLGPESGGVGSFDYVSGTMGTSLLDTMTAAHTGAFGFAASDRVNMFLVDFSNASNGMEDAGLTLFVMWGNQANTLGSGNVTIEPAGTTALKIGDGDAGFLGTSSEIYAFGDTQVVSTIFGFDVATTSSDTNAPDGFALTNLTGGDLSELQLYVLGSGNSGTDLLTGRLWDSGGNVWEGDDLLLIVPAPPAVLWGIAGLAGLVISRKRLAKLV